MLKDFIIKSLKETENYKKDIIVLKTVFVNLLEEQLKLIMNKLYEKNIFNENEIKVLNKTFGTIDIDKLISESNDKILKIEDLNELENSFENVNNIISSKNSELKIKNKNDRNSKKKKIIIVKQKKQIIVHFNCYNNSIILIIIKLKIKKIKIS